MKFKQNTVNGDNSVDLFSLFKEISELKRKLHSAANVDEKLIKENTELFIANRSLKRLNDSLIKSNKKLNDDISDTEIINAELYRINDVLTNELNRGNEGIEI